MNTSSTVIRHKKADKQKNCLKSTKLGGIVDDGHHLVKLAHMVNWKHIGELFSDRGHSNNKGNNYRTTRLMISIISERQRLLTKPAFPLAQNKQPYLHPTCVERQIVLRLFSFISTVST